MKYSFGKSLTMFTTHQRRTPITFYKDRTILVYDILNLLTELWKCWLSLGRMLKGNRSQLLHFLTRNTYFKFTSSFAIGDPSIHSAFCDVEFVASTGSTKASYSKYLSTSSGMWIIVAFKESLQNRGYHDANEHSGFRLLTMLHLN